MPKFEWDPEKARSNLLKHRAAFEGAELVWSDPLHLTRLDHHEGSKEQRHARGTFAATFLSATLAPLEVDGFRLENL